jgi:hypothetical protein
MLYCRSCAQAYHGTAQCKAKTSTADAEYMRKRSRKCPGCGETIQHFRNHGCHHVTCPSCKLEICYACGDPRSFCDKKPISLRCPLFCNERCQCTDCDECKIRRPCATCKGCKMCGL